MSIKHELADYRAKAQKRLGEHFSVVTRDLERLRTDGTLDHVLKVGQSVTAFELPDAFGNQVSLKTLLTKGPVVISFYRGEWCPFCNIELRGLQQLLPRMQQLGATLIAISPEKPDFGVIATQKNELTFPVLSDYGNKVARQFGLVFQSGQEFAEFSKNVLQNDLALRNADGSYEIPVPGTFVVDTAGLIRFAHADVDFMTGRAEPEAVVASLEALALAVA